MELGPQDAGQPKALAGKEPSELRKTHRRGAKAMTSIDGAADQLNRLVADSKGPISQFSENGPGRSCR